MPYTDDVLRRQDHLINTTGWAVTHVLPTNDGPDTAPFTYTVGLTAHDHPELLTAGLSPEIAHSLLNELARWVYDRAERFTHGQRIRDLIAGYDAIIIDGPPTNDLLPGMAIARYGRARVRLQQMVWPDRQGLFPWETGYGLGPKAQPLIAGL